MLALIEVSFKGKSANAGSINELRPFDNFGYFFVNSGKVIALASNTPCYNRYMREREVSGAGS